MPVWKKVLILVAVNMLYATEPILAQITSQFEFPSVNFVLGICGIIAVLGLYALSWQQILKHIELSTAYMFKGTSLIFVLLLSVICLDEVITVPNLIGAVMIVGGIVLFAKS